MLVAATIGGTFRSSGRPICEIWCADCPLVPKGGEEAEVVQACCDTDANSLSCKWFDRIIYVSTGIAEVICKHSKAASGNIILKAE